MSMLPFITPIIELIKSIIEVLSEILKIVTNKSTKGVKKTVFIFLTSTLVLGIIISMSLLIYKKISDGRTDPTTGISESLPANPTTNPTANPPSEIFIKNYPYNGGTYTGYINRSKHPDGQGTMTYSNGNEYTGAWENGIQQGQGQMTYSNGDVYDGHWENGKRNGRGEYTWDDEKNMRYIGYYVNDVREGQGDFWGWVDEEYGYSGHYCGKSKNDQFEGEGYFEFDNGDRFDGIFKENRYWSGTYTKNDGSQQKIEEGEPR